MIDAILGDLPCELVNAIQGIYQPAGMSVTSIPEREEESYEYGACRFELNRLKLVFRIGKVTSNRPGNFTTLWKRCKESRLVPLDSNEVDFVVVSVSNGICAGQFIFDRHILITKRIISHNGRKGKLAFRVFPPWVSPAKSALKTQEWQLKYFLYISQMKAENRSRMLKLFKV